MTASGSEIDYAPLSGRIAGRVHLPGEDGYTALATPWNLATTATPAAVVEVVSALDVAEAVTFAATVGLPVAVQATGHGIDGPLHDALLIHTGRLAELVVHPQGWARVGAGVKWAPVLEAAAEHGLAPLCGSAPDVSVVGYTTGGGIGPVARTWGAASDRVRAFDLVTGDGQIRRVTAESEPDLFWGVRGGKGSLGIVTAMEFDLVHQPEVYGGGLYLDGAHAADVLHTWRQWCADLPQEATTSVALLNLPDGVPGVPPPLAGRFSVCVRFVWTGDHARGQEVFAPMRVFAEPIMDMVGPMPFAQIGMVHADPVDPLPAHETNTLLRALPEDMVDALLALAGPGTGSPQLLTEIRQFGGALAREPEVPSALCHRDAAFSLETIGLMFPPVATAVVAHATEVAAAMAPWATGGQLPNFSPGAGPDGFRRCYDEVTYARLAALADRYDPHRVFTVGQVPERSAVPVTEATTGEVPGPPPALAADAGAAPE